MKNTIYFFILCTVLNYGARADCASCCDQCGEGYNSMAAAGGNSAALLAWYNQCIAPCPSSYPGCKCPS